MRLSNSIHAGLILSASLGLLGAASLKAGQEDAFGSLGSGSSSAAGKKWEFKVPYWQHKRCTHILASAGWPGRPQAPVFWLIGRYPAGVTARGISWQNNINPGDKTHLRLVGNLQPAGTDGVALAYELSAKTLETFKVGTHLYPLTEGRLFLLDLGTAPPQVQQLKADLGSLFPTDPAQEHFRAALTKLRAQLPALDRFLSEADQ